MTKLNIRSSWPQTRQKGPKSDCIGKASTPFGPLKFPIKSSRSKVEFSVSSPKPTVSSARTSILPCKTFFEPEFPPLESMRSNSPTRIRSSGWRIWVVREPSDGNGSTALIMSLPFCLLSIYLATIWSRGGRRSVNWIILGRTLTKWLENGHKSRWIAWRIV